MYNVILIDDEPAVLSGLKKALPWSEYGFESVVALSNPFEALELMQNETFDMMITDICMPQMNGLELLKKARALNPDMSCIILTAYDEFDYVLESLRLGAENFLLKPINVTELTSTVLKALNNINNSKKLNSFLKNSETIFKENVLFRWLSGDLFGQELTERAKLAGINLFKRAYNVIVVKPLIDASHFTTVISDIKKCFLNAPEAYEYYYLVDMHGWSVFIVSGHECSSQKLKKALSSLTPRYASASLMVGVIGDEVLGSKNLPASYHAAIEIMNYSMLFEPNTFISSEEISTQIRKLNYNITIDVSKLLTEYNEESAMEEIKNYVSYILQESKTSLQTIRAFIIEFLLRLARELERSNVSGVALPESIQNMFVKIDTLNSQKELTQWLCQVVSDARYLIQNGFQDVSPIISRVLKYVDAHYVESNITIKRIASHFSVNSSYLGYLFKQETGLYFSDYLNHIRVKQGEHLLLTTDYSITDIAAKVGYSDMTYFSQIFKKRTGVSPAKYRQMKRNSPSSDKKNLPDG